MSTIISMATQSQNKAAYQKDLQWKNWLNYLNATSDRLDKLGDLGRECYFNTKYLNVFFAELKMFMVTRKSYIDNYDELKIKLDKLGDILFKENYMNDLINKNNVGLLRETQYKIMKELTIILEDIQTSLSDGELLPKIGKKYTKDPKNAILGNT